jgi:hypothetical protein
MKNDLNDLFVNPALALYDGEGDEGGGGGDGAGAPAGAGAAAAAAAANAAAAASGKPKVFTQDDLNRFMAEDRRKHQEKVEKVEGEYKRVLENFQLTEQQRKQLEEGLETVRAESRTKEENLAKQFESLKNESQKTAKQLAEERDSWKNRFETTEIRRSIQDAAVKGEAYRSDHILAILQPLTRMTTLVDPSGKPTGDLAPRIHWPATDAKTGESVTNVFTADEAVGHMKEKTDEYGYLFKSNAQGGIGGGNGTGTTVGKNGKVDVTQLTPSEYRKLRKTNPGSIGLK